MRLTQKIYFPPPTYTHLDLSTVNIHYLRDWSEQRYHSAAIHTMAPPSFLDRLAPELRIDIYGHIFGTSDTIKPSSSTASLGINKELYALTGHNAVGHVNLESSILSTNKIIFGEAIQVLYHNRTFRATFTELGRLLKHKDFVANVEKVEVADCVSDYKDCSNVLKQLQLLPRIRSVVILSDCLAFDEGYSGMTGYEFAAVPVPEFVETAANLGRATCIDIGRYQLHGKYSKVQVINRRLTEMWPSAQDVTDSYDAWAHLETIMQEWEPLVDVPDRLPLTLQTSFKCWIGLHEEIASMEASGKLAELRDRNLFGSLSDADAVKRDVLNRFTYSTVNSRLSERPYFIEEWFEQGPEKLNLRHLVPGDDPKTLCWATEYLAANIAVFCHDAHRTSHYPFLDYMASHWVEADGGKHVIEQKISHQKLALGGVPNRSYILEPVRKNTLIDYSTALRQLETTQFEHLAFPIRAHEMEPLEFMLLVHVSIAELGERRTFRLPTDASYQQELDDWADDLLRRHLLASEWCDPTIVQDMSLEDLRMCLFLLIRGPSLKEIRTDPPEDLDSDFSHH